MAPNFLVIALCALIPFIFAYIWFHPKAFGGDYWNKISGISSAKSNKKVKPFYLILSIFLNFFIAFGIFVITVHGTHVFSLTGPSHELMSTGTALAFMQEYGDNYTSWTHGISHGMILATVAFVVPIIGYVTIFEHKSFRYFLVYVGYWGISLTTMACIITQYGWVKVY